MPRHMLPSTDFSRACWRCRHWGGVYQEVHNLCRGPGGVPVHASPRTGCCYWEAGGPGHGQPDDWRPVGLRINEHHSWYRPEPIGPVPPPADPDPEPRPGSSDHGEWLIRRGAQAWRATDALLGRLRRG